MNTTQNDNGTGKIIPFPANPVTIFDNPEFGQVRVIVKDDLPWFVAKDMCDVLGYSNSSKAVEDHCKHAKLLKGNDSLGLTDSPRGITIIPESDVYRLIIRSNLPAAEKFEAWLMEEVIPAIRQHGIYATPDVADAIINDPDLGIRLLTELKHERTAKAEAIALAKAEADRAEYYRQTKALIGSRREATSMATASAAVRKAAALENELGEGRDFKQAKSVPWVKEMFDVKIKGFWGQLGKWLKKFCNKHGFPYHDIENTEFGTVLAYHKDGLAAARDYLLRNPDELPRYRKN